MLETAIIVTIAFLLDMLLGETKKFHPLVGFGWIASRVEKILFRGEESSTRVCGVVGWTAMVMPVVFLALLSQYLDGYWGMAVQIAGLYLVIGSRSLVSHAMLVGNALDNQNLPIARERVGWIVSRDTDQLDEGGVVTATVESVLENGNDAIFGAIFWFVVAGLPGALLFRAVNTLDAMWGYKSERFLDFGWFSARVDDFMNWIPSRLTALSYALLGDRSTALSSWGEQAALCKSPNAGAVMSSGAGALKLQLGGKSTYHGEIEEKPLLGSGRAAEREDICRTLSLVNRSVILWIALLWTIATFTEIFRLYG